MYICDTICKTSSEYEKIYFRHGGEGASETA